jgi:hypothetical protein
LSIAVFALLAHSQTNLFPVKQLMMLFANSCSSSMSNNFIATKVIIQFRRNLEFRNKAVAKLAILGFAFLSAYALGKTPNLPMWAGIKIFFKIFGWKIFKTLFWLACRKIGRSVSRYGEINC